MATTKTAKQVQVLCRYAHKTNGELNGIVTYCVKSSKNKDFYYTTLVNGKASGCSCPARKPCYHMTQLTELEWTRYRREVARKLVAQNLTVEMVEQIVEQQQVETTAQPVAPKVVEVAEALDIPVAEVAAIAVIAAEHRKETTEGKHTDFELPIGPRDTKKDWTKSALTRKSSFSLMKQAV